MFNTPILLIVFNRPDTTKQVFESIKTIKPKQLFIAADGPRLSVPTDVEKCNEVKEIVKAIDWDCELKTLYRTENIGCGRGPSEAITWFFDNVEEGIILEDDCVPHTDFYKFCAEMLEKYRNNHQITSISGSNFQNGIKRGYASYYFSAFNPTWGWATWKRTWEKYEYNLASFSTEEIKILLKQYLKTKKQQDYYYNSYFYSKMHQMDNSAWDYQFTFLQWRLQGLSIIPNANLVRNIGFSTDATHTQLGEKHPLFVRKTDAIYPINYPTKMEINLKADEYFFNKYIKHKTNLIKKIKRIINKIRKIKIL